MAMRVTKSLAAYRWQSRWPLIGGRVAGRSHLHVRGLTRTVCCRTEPECGPEPRSGELLRGAAIAARRSPGARLATRDFVRWREHEWCTRTANSRAATARRRSRSLQASNRSSRARGSRTIRSDVRRVARRPSGPGPSVARANTTRRSAGAAGDRQWCRSRLAAIDPSTARAAMTRCGLPPLPPVRPRPDLVERLRSDRAPAPPGPSRFHRLAAGRYRWA